MFHNYQDRPNEFHRPDRVREKLYVITPVFNPIRYRQRWKLYQDFEKYVLSFGEAHLVTIEASFANRDEVLVEDKGENHTVIHVQTTSELWTKEILINLAIQKLPPDWKYAAWIDSDVTFARPDWVGETIQQLQHYQIVQMFSEAVDLTPDFEIYQKHRGFVWCYENKRIADKAYSGWHPGFAWAARREYINTVGGLIDISILGAGDRNMATALIGRLHDSIPEGLHPEYVRQLEIWSNRAALIRKNIGFVKGTLLHYFHGKKKNRQYTGRWNILIDEQYDPTLDLKRDWQGLWQLTDRNISLRDKIRGYFRQRNEDSIDL